MIIYPEMKEVVIWSYIPKSRRMLCCLSRSQRRWKVSHISKIQGGGNLVMYPEIQGAVWLSVPRSREVVGWSSIRNQGGCIFVIYPEIKRNVRLVFLPEMKGDGRLFNYAISRGDFCHLSRNQERCQVGHVSRNQVEWQDIYLNPNGDGNVVGRPSIQK